MARRVLNRKDLRADFEAAERRKQEDEEVDEESEDEEDEEDEEGGEAKEGDEEEAPELDEEEEVLQIVKKKKAPAKPKATKAKPRSRSAKVTRMKVVWGVFNNSNQRVAVYDYPKRKEADEHAAKLTTDKKQTHFVQPVKEPFEEKAS